MSALAEGRTLRALLDAKVRFEINRVVEIGRQILHALDHAHGRGVLHRNLRPENIFVTDDDRVSVSDFGLGVRLTDLTTQELQTGRLMMYTPPEALLKDRVDARSDLFSLGVVLYEIVTGKRPFDAESLQAICGRVLSSTPLPASHANPSLPAGFDGVIARCLAKDPSARYATAEALAQDLYPLARRKVIPQAAPQTNGNGLRDRAARLLRSA